MAAFGPKLVAFGPKLVVFRMTLHIYTRHHIACFLPTGSNYCMFVCSAIAGNNRKLFSAGIIFICLGSWRAWETQDFLYFSYTLMIRVVVVMIMVILIEDDSDDDDDDVDEDVDDDVDDDVDRGCNDGISSVGRRARYKLAMIVNLLCRHLSSQP